MGHVYIYIYIYIPCVSTGLGTVREHVLGGEGPAHPAHADNAQTRPGHLLAHHEGGRPAIPLSLPHKPVATHRMPRRAQHQEHRDLCRGIRQNIRRVGDHDTGLLERRQIAVIHPDRMVGHDPEAGIQPRNDVSAEML